MESLGINQLISEIKNNELKKDVLHDSSLEFSGERQAQYFSNLRNNMNSDMAGIVMFYMNQTPELQLLKKWSMNGNE